MYFYYWQGDSPNVNCVLWSIGFQTLRTSVTVTSLQANGPTTQKELCARWNIRMVIHMYMCVCVCVYITHIHPRESNWSPNSTSLSHNWPQLDRPAACVIAQQYSSVAFVSWHFDSHEEKSIPHFRNITSFPLVFFFIFLFFFLSRKSEFAKLWIS